MSDIIHNMEHPMISELRAQMEVQQGKYESELAEKQEKIEELEADISDLDSSFRTIVETKPVPYIPEDVKSAVNKLKDVLDNYV